MSYQLPSSFLQKFTPKEIHELKRVFKEHDRDYAAAIPTDDLHTVLLKMGENVSPPQTQTILAQVPLARPTEITFAEFLNLFYDLRTGGIAVDAAALRLEHGLSLNATSTPVTATATPLAPTVVAERVPFFPRKSGVTSDDDEDDESRPKTVRASPTPFATKAQWPPAPATTTTSSASPTTPSAPSKPQWPPAAASVSATTNGAKSITPPKQWPPVAPSPPKEKPQWPPAATTTTAPAAPSPAKPQWPPAAAAAPSSPSAKPQWPPVGSTVQTSPSKPQWPPATPAPPSPPSSKPQWPPAAATETTQPRHSITKAAQWPPSGDLSPAKSAQEPSPSSTKAQWPPAGAAAAPSSAAKSQWPPATAVGRAGDKSPTTDSVGAGSSNGGGAANLDAHTLGVLQRRQSAAAMYNANVTIHEVKGPVGASSVHSYSAEETAAFTEHINNCLHQDRDLAAVVPIHTQDGLFRAVSDGVLLCKLVNAAVPETIDLRAVNLKKAARALNVYEMTENQNLCINAAKSIGCSVVNIGPTDLIEGRPILVLGLVWQIIKIQLTSTINLKNHPELVRLLLDGESLEAFMKLPPDQILLRWVNYHLRAAGHPKTVTNFSSDVQDATAYSVLLHQIAPQSCDVCNEPVAEDRAGHVIQNARKLDIETFIKPRDITSGNPKLNMSFVAQLFNTCPALDVVAEELKQLEDILYDDVGDTREERVFRMWINSLGIDEVYINHLFSDLREGINLLKLFDKIEKGIVAWQKVNLVAPNKFKQVENCNYCVVLGKQLRFSLVNIGGADIYEGNKKLILSIIWQSMRYHQLKLLSELAARGRGAASGEGITDADIIQWANAKVRNGGGKPSAEIVAFRDPSLADSLYLLSLIHAVEPRAVNWEMVTPGHTEDDKTGNAKYAISCAQKIGATVFLTFEDIVEVKPKMMMTFVASLMSVDMHRR